MFCFRDLTCLLITLKKKQMLYFDPFFHTALSIFVTHGPFSIVLPVLPIEAKANGYAAGVPGGDLLDLGPAPTSPAPAAPAGSVDLLDM